MSPYMLKYHFDLRTRWAWSKTKRFFAAEATSNRSRTCQDDTHADTRGEQQTSLGSFPLTLEGQRVPVMHVSPIPDEAWETAPNIAESNARTLAESAVSEPAGISRTNVATRVL